MPTRLWTGVWMSKPSIFLPSTWNVRIEVGALLSVVTKLHAFTLMTNGADDSDERRELDHIVRVKLGLLPIVAVLADSYGVFWK
uniref:Uncharacterized protein n=1 Tax=Oryza meridionalis TaxID=40149 RepID=A0A0E0CXZ6_9ORYZ